MLFHVQERCFVLSEIGAMLDQLNLRFIGFSLDSPTTERDYRTAFPDDATMTDLSAWDSFEAEHPDDFHGMFQFWRQKPAAAGDGGDP